MATLLTRMTEHPLTAAELDNANADKRAPMWWNTFADTAPTGCTGNCNQGRACDCVADVATDWTPEQINYLRVIAWVGSPLVAVGIIALIALYLN